VEKILERFPELTSNDVSSRSMGAGGRDILLSEAALRRVPFAIECKSYASFAVYKHYDQARANAGGPDIPLLIIKQNRSQPLVCLSLDHFMELLCTLKKQ
jgi:hypothetical protein